MESPGLLRRWRKLTFEQKTKVGGLVATGVLVPSLLFALGQVLAPRPETAERLEVLDLAVDGGEKNAGTPQFLDITVRNAGATVSVIKKVTLTVRAFETLVFCETGGFLDASRVYAEVDLPLEPAIGQTVEVKVHQDVAADAADRFSLGLSVPTDQLVNIARLYQLEVVLFHDAAQAGTPAGKAIVAVPYEPSASDFGSTCFARENWTAMTSILALDGARSDSLPRVAPPEPPSVGPVAVLGSTKEFVDVALQEGMTCEDHGLVTCHRNSSSGDVTLYLYTTEDPNTYVSSVELFDHTQSQTVPELFGTFARLALGDSAETWVTSAALEPGAAALVQSYGEVELTIERWGGTWEMTIGSEPTNTSPPP